MYILCTLVWHSNKIVVLDYPRTAIDMDGTLHTDPKYLKIVFVQGRGWKGKTKSLFLDYKKPIQVRA